MASFDIRDDTGKYGLVGDYIRIKGQLGINRYAPKNADKVQEKVALTGWSFVPVEWDSEQNKYIDKEIPQAA